MYDYISGTVAQLDDEYCVLDNGGIGYAFRISAASRALLNRGEEALLYVHVVHREDVFELLGFATSDEREVFEKLLSVSGIGPKQAQKILSGLSPAALVHAVVNADLPVLTAIPGLGKKTAEKIIFELSGKLDLLLSRLSGTATVFAAPDALHSEAVRALESLGCSRMAAQNAVHEAARESTDSKPALEDLIKAALRHI